MHMPSVFWMVVCVCLTLALSVCYAAGRKDPNGLKIWAAGLVAHGAAYALFSFRGQIPDIFSVIIANALISMSYAFFLWAVLKFLRRPIDAFLLVAPPVVLVVVYAVLMPFFTIRVMAGNSILSAQCAVICFYLIGHHFDYRRRGRNLVLLSMCGLITVFAWRIGTALFDPQNLAAHFQTNLVQTATYITVLTAMVLSSNGFVLMVQDCSEHQLRHTAMKDALTGCWNRFYITEVAEQERMRLKRYGVPVSLILANIDGLKSINRQFGHSAGDKTLCTLAEVARKTFRATDYIGRLEKGTFAIVLPATGFGDAVQLAEQLRCGFSALALPFGYSATISVGVAICRSIDSWDLWHNRAVAALHMAVATGRNRVVIENFSSAPAGGVSASGPRDVSQMMLLRWSKTYETGIAHIDAQHKAILEKANTLFMLGIAETNKEAVLALLAPLLTEVTNHFADEEVLLRQMSGYAAQDHICLHYYLSKRLDDLKNRFRADKIGTMELFHFLMFECIVQHILIEDMQVFSTAGADGDIPQRVADQAMYPPSRLTALS